MEYWDVFFLSQFFFFAVCVTLSFEEWRQFQNDYHLQHISPMVTFDIFLCLQTWFIELRCKETISAISNVFYLQMSTMVVLNLAFFIEKLIPFAGSCLNKNVFIEFKFVFFILDEQLQMRIHIQQEKLKPDLSKSKCMYVARNPYFFYFFFDKLPIGNSNEQGFA